MKKPFMIMIMDGFGLNDSEYGNAVKAAKKPELDEIFEKYPMTRIDACGERVGLPQGQMGNSEVGHLNIGGGRIVYQDLLLITNAIRDGSFFENKALKEAMEHAKKNDSTLHLFGLLSDGGVHSHIDHLFALLDMADSNGLDKIAVHCFLDGRDVPPRCAGEYIAKLESKLLQLGKGNIASISGRYYSMDRDKRWERLSLSYDMLTLGTGIEAGSAAEALEMAYERDENDEFVKPTIIAGGRDAGARASTDDGPGAGTTVQDGDSIIMFNFRPDRAREITRAFVDPDFDGFERKAIPQNLYYCCMTEYDATMPNVSLAFPPEHYDNTLGEYLSKQGLSQLRIAETEKYAHVTFFFNGGVEEPNPNEDRILIPSPKVATYDLKPEMSAYEVRDRVLEEIDKDKYDVIILNFANADMVGHTGVFDAAVKAIETLNDCVPPICEKILEKDGQVLLTADHGNADVMLDEEGNVVTAHSLNQVPLIHIARDPRPLRDGGKLADIAPTLLTLMDLPVPEEMSGDVLV